VLTVWQCYMMLRQMELKTEYRDTEKGLTERGLGMRERSAPVKLASRILKTIKLHWFFIFLLLPLNMIHPVPGLSMGILIEQLGLQTEYRVESLVVGAMLPRVYHVFLLYKLKLLTSVLSLDSSLIVRNESAIRQLNDPGLSQPQLAFKIALQRTPMKIIFMCWTVCVKFPPSLLPPSLPPSLPLGPSLRAKSGIICRCLLLQDLLQSCGAYVMRLPASS
jgi:hypothetical protein